MIRINVFIQVSEANRTAVLDAAKELTACSLKEEGCIAYDIFESSTRPDVLMICETWADDITLGAYEKSAHFATLVGIIQQLTVLKLDLFKL